MKKKNLNLKKKEIYICVIMWTPSNPEILKVTSNLYKSNSTKPVIKTGCKSLGNQCRIFKKYTKILTKIARKFKY